MPLAGIVIAPMVALSVSMLIVSFIVVVYNITQVSFRQRLCPRPLLGRMNASIRFIVWGMHADRQLHRRRARRRPTRSGR